MVICKLQHFTYGTLYVVKIYFNLELVVYMCAGIIVIQFSFLKNLQGLASNASTYVYMTEFRKITLMGAFYTLNN